MTSRFAAIREEIAEHRRRWGWRRTLHGLVMRALRRAIDLEFFVLNVRSHAASPPATPLAAGQSVRRLDRGDLERASEDPRLDLPPAFVAEALARGDFCMGVFDADRLIAYVWRAFGPTPVSEDLWIDFGPPYRYGYKALTLPEHRGAHLQDAISYSTDRLSIERGRTHGVSVVESHNFPSRAADRRRGNVVVGYAASFRVFGRHFVWNSPNARRIGVRLVTAGDVH